MVSANSRLIAFRSESNAFYGQRNPESRFARKETVDIDILTTSWNADSKIMQSNKITCRLHLRIRKWSKLSQFS